MPKNPMRKHLAVLMAACLVLLSATALAAGGQDDPLVSLSYLNDTFLPQLLRSVDEKIAARNELMGKQTSGDSAETFTVVTLEAGQTLVCGTGCELMLRSGSVVCAASASPGLIDETDGSSLDDGGSLMPNHLYLAASEGHGVSASGSAKLLVRGGYRIG